MLLPLFAANVFALLEPARVLQDGLIGAGIGAIVSKAIVHRAERIRGELPPQRVRQIDLVWIGLLGGLALLLSLGARVGLG
jgi:hypothetical protein